MIETRDRSTDFECEDMLWNDSPWGSETERTEAIEPIHARFLYPTFAACPTESNVNHPVDPSRRALLLSRWRTGSLSQSCAVLSPFEATTTTTADTRRGRFNLNG